MQDLQAKLLKPDGDTIDTGGAPAFGFGIETAPEYDRFNPLNLVEGRWPSGDGEVAVDEGVADGESLELGERIGVAAVGPAQQFEIVGIAQYGDLSSLGSATFAVFTSRPRKSCSTGGSARRDLRSPPNDGVDPEELTQRIQTELGADVHRAYGSRAG